MKQRKHFVRSTVEKLPPEQREQVHEWLRANLTYKQVALRLYGVFGVKVSPGALGSYYQKQFMQAELRRVAAEEETPAAGVEVIILFPAPGRLHVQVRPLEE